MPRHRYFQTGSEVNPRSSVSKVTPGSKGRRYPLFEISEEIGDFSLREPKPGMVFFLLRGDGWLESYQQIRDDQNYCSDKIQKWEAELHWCRVNSQSKYEGELRTILLFPDQLLFSKDLSRVWRWSGSREELFKCTGGSIQSHNIDENKAYHIANIPHLLENLVHCEIIDETRKNLYLRSCPDTGESETSTISYPEKSELAQRSRHGREPEYPVNQYDHPYSLQGSSDSYTFDKEGLAQRFVPGCQREDSMTQYDNTPESQALITSHPFDKEGLARRFVR